MTIYINEEDKKLFEQNGFDQQSVGNTVNHYRSIGLSDDEIQGKINQRLEGWRAPKQKVTNPVTYANQDLSGIENDVNAQKEFKKNVDSLYNIPQVEMPDRNNAGYTNSDGEVYPQRLSNGQAFLQGGIDQIRTNGAPVLQGLSNIGKDLSRFGSGLIHGAPQFFNEIKNQAAQTGSSIKQSPLQATGNAAKAFGHGIDQAFADIVGGVMNLPEAIAASYNGREYNPKYSYKAPVEGYADLLTDVLYNKGILTPEQYDKYYQNKEQVNQAMNQVPLAKTIGEFVPAMLPIGRAAGLGKAAQTAENLTRAEKAVKVASDIAKAGGVGAGYGLLATPEDLGTRAESAGAGFGVGATLGAGGKAIQAGARASLPYAAEAGYQTGKAARKAVDFANEIKERLNPENYETVLETQPVQRGTGLSQKTVYESSVKRVYKPKNRTERDITPEKNYITDNGTDFVMGESGELKTPQKPAHNPIKGYLAEIAPKTIEKMAAPKTAENLRENKPKHYKRVNGKMVQVLEDGTYKELPNKYSNIAPNTVANKEAREAAKNERVENTENLQANEIVGQEGNTSDDIENVAKEYSQMLGQDEVRDFHRDFAAALVNKNADKIKNLVAQGRGLNENSKKMFTKYTGIKLPSTIQGKKDVIDKWANGEINSETTQEEVKNSLLPSYKYKVTVHKNGLTADGLTADGLYMEGSNFHTDGSAAYLKEFVNADTSKVERVTKANESSEQGLKKYFDNAGQYTSKLEDIGKGIKRNKETWRALKAGEYDNGEPKYVVINDKYLLDKKDIELYVDENNLLAPVSIRKNGKQIGIVMPIMQRNGFNTSDMVDIKPLKYTAKKAKQINDVESLPDKNSNYITDVQNLIANKDNAQKVDIGIVDGKVKEVAKKANIDLEGYRHNIDKSSVNHILNRHGEGENYRNQVPVTEDDIKNIPDIIYNADNVEYTGKNDKNLDTFKITKKVDDGTIYYIEEVRTGKKTLTADSMYKKVERSDVKNPKSLTSETTPTDNIITHNEENLNTITESVRSSGQIVLDKGNFRAGILNKGKKFEVILGEKFPDSEKYKMLTPTLGRPSFKTEQEAREYATNWLNDNTLKTRETDKGVELYDEEFNPIKPITDLISNVNKYFETKEAIKSGSSFEDLSNNNEIFKAIREELENRTDYNGNTLFEHIKDYTFTDMVKADKTPNKYGLHVGRNKAIYINTEAIEALPQNEQTGRFINTVRHEIEHAIQEKLYNDIVETRGLKDSELKIFKSLAEELVKEKPSSNIISTLNSIINKIANKRNLRNYEVEALKHYAELKVVNRQKSEYYKKHKDVLKRYFENTLGKTKIEARKVYNKLKQSHKIIVDNYTRLFNNYYNTKYEANARKTGETKAKEVINANNGRTTLQLPRLSKQRNVGTRPQNSSPSEELGDASEEFEGFRETKTAVNKNTGDEINQVVRDKVYDWHGKLESDRYDVDKALNSFINLTKHKAKNLSQKTGVKISDKQLREILPFLRERTGFPKTLDRDDLRNIFNKLSGEDKAELVKLADSISDKFEKYYTNYKEAKGEQTDESIENHISHIWDLDDKKKSLLTNYITTNSKFAKKRTIGTFVEGIDGIEINGEKVQFKPKTLDYAEILKSSSDNLIKATHDSILANEIKNLRYKGEPMVLPAAKAPSEWEEVSHPALNKAVYMGSVGEDEIPMIIKTPVKVHPEIADYVKAIFEVQKNSKFWNGFDAANGIVKQVLLSGSGFHGYALSESAVGNVGLVRTLKELNPIKIYDQIKNGNYEIYKNEEFAKRAIKAGVQLGTPSDLQRNLTEDILKKVPLAGKVLSGAAQLNNKVLWDVLFNNYKLLVFNTAAENIEASTGRKATVEEERAVAQWVNDSFGGQVWELLGIKKSSVKTASRILLSPDWNFSTVRQANAILNTKQIDKLINSNNVSKRIGKLLGVSEENSSNGMRGKKGRVYWLRAAIYLTTMFNLMNAVFREKDRKEHPDLYPDEMTPMDYTIWSNSYPMDNFYEKMLPNIFIGRNKDGSARYLRLGKQFREVPEFLFNFVGKMGGKTAPLLSMLFRVYFGMGINDAWDKLNGGEAYLDQNIWEGYGDDADKKEGLDLLGGRAVVALKSVTPFMMSKYLSDNKHEFSWWDLVAQTHSGGAKSTVFKQVKEALKAGKPELIQDIERKSYQDGVSFKDIEAMVEYAKKDYKTENTKKYKKKLTDSYKNGDIKEYERIRKKMAKKHLSEEEQRRIRNKAWEDYQKSNEN